MIQQCFDVYLTGGIAPGQQRQAVVAALAQLVRVSETRAGALLAGRPVRMKAQVDQATAQRYQAALAATGAGAEVRPHRQVAGSAPEGAAPARLNPALRQAVAEDATQPFTETVSRPGRTRRAFRPAWVMLALCVLAGVGGAAWWLMPVPAVPGQSLALVGQALNLAQPYQQQVETFWHRNRHAPASATDLALRHEVDLNGIAALTLVAPGRLQLTFLSDRAPAIAGQTLWLQARQGDQGVEWDCGGGTLMQSERPRECRSAALN